jgi:16S rRNA (adenine1518-N6/adenine1519-N6)-dimethyltransferase
MRRRLGQHFLRARSVSRLLDLLDPRPDQDFLEIGAGRGALTLPLAARARKIVAIELDAHLAEELRARSPANVVVVQGDALRLDLGPLLPEGGRLVGNLPYAISSPLLRRFLDLRKRTPDAHLMLQTEVARRIASPPGTKSYGILSVLYGVHADVDIPIEFGPECFAPPPKVSSALLRVRFLAAPRVPTGPEPAFETLVQRAFAHRRKTLENNLQHSYHNLKQHLRLLDILGSRRAETLTVGEFARLAEALATETSADG